MGETTQNEGPCGHDGREFTAYSMNDLDGTEARRVAKHRPPRVTAAGPS